MGRKDRAFVAIIALALPLYFTACASGRRPPPPPAVDPVKEQITILQKQLLELQNVQNETRRAVEEQAAVVRALDSRVSTLETQRMAPATSGPGSEVIKSTKKTTAKKKAAKKRSSKRKRTR